MAVIYDVVVSQLNNGAPSGGEMVIESLVDETPAEALARKADSHVANGWEVTWLTAVEFHAVKSYPEGHVKERRFSLHARAG